MGKFYANQTFRQVSAASVNEALIKSTPGAVKGWVFTNDSAGARFVGLYNKATAPVAGTDTPRISITVPANSSVSLNLGEMGVSFDLGIGIAVTAAAGDADVISQIFYR